MSDRRYAELTVNVVRQLEALRKTVHIDNQDRFWTTVNNFSDLNSFYDTVTLLSWGAYFPPPDIDKELVHTHVFLVISGIVPLNVHDAAAPLNSLRKRTLLSVGSIGAVKPSTVFLLPKGERRNVAGRSFVPAVFRLSVIPGLEAASHSMLQQDCCSAG